MLTVESYPGDEPPAVVSLLAGKLSSAGLCATLADLAHRRQTVISSEDSPDEFYVVVDDGVRPQARNLQVDGGPYGLLTAGTYVHVRVNLDHRKQVTVLQAGPSSVAGPVQVNLLQSPAGRAMSWQLTGTTGPVLRIDVRPAGRSPAGLAPSQVGQPVPGVAGGYLLRSKAVLYTASRTVILTIRGTAPAGNDGALVHIMSLMAQRVDFNQY